MSSGWSLTAAGANSERQQARASETFACPSLAGNRHPMSAAAAIALAAFVTSQWPRTDEEFAPSLWMKTPRCHEGEKRCGIRGQAYRWRFRESRAALLASSAARGLVP